MAVYTTLLGAGHIAAGDEIAVVYTAPDNGVVVIRDCVITAYSNVLPDIGFQVAPPGGGTLVLAIWPEVARLDSKHWQGRQVLLPGENLLAYISDGPGDYRVTGYLLGL